MALLLNSFSRSLSLCLLILFAFSIDAFPVGSNGETPLGGSTVSSAIPVLVGVAVLCALALAIFGCSCCDESSLLKYEETLVSEDHPNRNNVDDFSPPSESTPNVTHNGEKVHIEPLPDLSAKLKTTPQIGTSPLNNVALKDLKNIDSPKLKFPRENLNYVEEIGSGWFGKALRAEAHDMHPGMQKTRVIVKQLRDSASKDEQELFLKEVQPYREVNHPNVLMLLGQCIDAPPYLLIMEFAPYGDLKGFLIKNEAKHETMAQDGTLLKMACDVSAGALWLHNSDFIHIDLAARNCQVCADRVVKIGDYGISLEKYPDEYHITKNGRHAMPIRWLAPEVVEVTAGDITPKKITKESNVWSFGVIMFELSSSGGKPYDNHTDQDVIDGVIKNQELTMNKPNLAMRSADRWYEIMTACWVDSVTRPKMNEVHDLLHHLKAKDDFSKDDFEQRWDALRGGSKKGHSEFEDDFSPVSPDSSSAAFVTATSELLEDNDFINVNIVDNTLQSTDTTFISTDDPFGEMDIFKGDDSVVVQPQIDIDVQAPEVETPKVETPKVETPKVETPKVETPKVETLAPSSVQVSLVDVDVTSTDDDPTPSLFLTNAGLTIKDKPADLPSPVVPKTDDPTDEFHGYASVKIQPKAPPQKMTLTVSSGKKKKVVEIQKEDDEKKKEVPKSVLIDFGIKSAPLRPEPSDTAHGNGEIQTPSFGGMEISANSSDTTPGTTLNAGGLVGLNIEVGPDKGIVTAQGDAGIQVIKPDKGLGGFDFSAEVETVKDDVVKAQSDDVVKVQNPDPPQLMNLDIKVDGESKKDLEVNGSTGLKLAGGVSIKADDQPQKDTFKADEDIEDNPDRKRGQLSFSVIYRKAKMDLVISIVHARKLKSMDVDGKSDPYVKLHILPRASSREKSTKLKTTVKYGTLNPTYNEELVYHGITTEDMQTKTLRLTVWDADVGRNDFIGEYRLALKKLRPDETKNFTKYLQDQGAEEEISSDERGKILLSLEYFLKPQQLLVGIIRCSGLKSMDDNGLSDPYVKTYLQPDPNKKTKQKTKTKKKTLNPEYNENLIYKIKLEELKTKTLEVTVWDKDVGVNDYIGGIQLGYKATGERLKHWKEVLENPDKRIEKWHNLSEEKMSEDD